MQLAILFLENATIKKELYEKESDESVVKVYIDYKEMLENEEIDIVTIATESGYHAEIAIYCMNKGKHVIVEKPMALSIEDADRMIKCGKDNNVKLCVCNQNRNKSIQRLRQALEDNKLGAL